MKNKYKILFLCFSIATLTIFGTSIVNNSTKAADVNVSVQNLPYVGYCNGSRIVKAYVGPVTTPNGIKKTYSKLVIPGYDSLFKEFAGVPYVEYSYVDAYGNIQTPSRHATTSTINNLRLVKADFGPCPTDY